MDGPNWEPTQDQQLAQTIFQRWWRERSTPYFYLSGYAGTGKTTCIQHMLASVGVTDVAACTYTGKAARVLARKGFPDAQTIHKTIYRTRFIKTLVPAVPDNEADRLRRLGHEVPMRTKKVCLTSLVAAVSGQVILVDECSMLNAKLWGDLLSFGKPVIVLGDPGQLPPISGQYALAEVPPHATLTQITRQNADSGIIKTATEVRQTGCWPSQWEHHDSQHIAIRERDLAATVAMLAEDPGVQIISGKKETCRQIILAALEATGCYDRATMLPRKGAKLLCWQNSQEYEFRNGEIVELLDDPRVLRDRIVGQLLGEDGTLYEDVEIGRELFEANRRPIDKWKNPKECSDRYEQFDYGYGLTVHKAQGSEWDHVAVIDDGFACWRGAAETRRQWTYTAVTRASQQLSVIEVAG